MAQQPARDQVQQREREVRQVVQQQRVVAREQQPEPLVPVAPQVWRQAQAMVQAHAAQTLVRQAEQARQAQEQGRAELQRAVRLALKGNRPGMPIIGAAPGPEPMTKRKPGRSGAPT
jgi:hypothetical protein